MLKYLKISFLRCRNIVLLGSFFLCFSLSAQTPGAVSEAMNLWLKANLGSSCVIDGCSLNAWSDQSASSNDGVQATTNEQPSYVGVSNNYNPGISINATLMPKQHLELPNSTVPSGNSSYTIFYVVNNVTNTGFVIAAGQNLNSRANRFRVDANGGTKNSWQNTATDIQTASSVDLAANRILQCTNYDNTIGRNVFVQGLILGSSIATNLNTSNSNNHIGIREDGGGGFLGDINEIIIFPTALSVLDQSKVESYLAVKYGITLGSTASPLNYVSSNGSLIWIGDATYQNDIIGIGRDDASDLIQRQSHTDDDLTRVYIDALETTNIGNIGVFSADNGYVLMGHNTDVLCSTVASNAEVPASPLVIERLAREWKVTNTNFTDDFNWDVTTNGCAAFSGVLPSNLRLLVDTDGDFTNANVYGAGGGLSFGVNGNTITVSGISNLNLPNNTTRYFTIGIVTDPIADFEPSELVVCEGETITFTDESIGDNINQWDWTFNGGDITSANTQGPHDVVFNNAGVYDIVLEIEDANGSDDTTIQVTVTALPDVNAGLDITACESSEVTLTAFNPDIATITWDNGVIDGTAFISPVGTVTYTVSADLLGCVVTDEVDVTILDSIDFDLTYTNPTSCLGTDGTILITGLSPFSPFDISYTNGIVQGPTAMMSDAAGEISLSGLSAGTYQDFIVMSTICQTTNNTIISLEDPQAPIVNAGDDQQVCELEEVVLTAINPDGAVVSWNNSITNGLGFTAPLGTTTYEVTATLNGCSSTDEVDVTSVAYPNISITGAVNNTLPSVCEGESVVFSAINPDNANLTWDNGVVDGVPFSNLNIGVNQFELTADLQGCISTEQISITVNTLPQVGVLGAVGGILPSVCEGTSIVLEAINPNNANISWSNGVIDGDVFTGLNTGLNSFTVTADLNGCVSSDQVEITVIEIPEVGVQSNPGAVCEGLPVTLTAYNPNNAIISWNNGIQDGVPFSNLPAGTYIYTVTADLQGCISTENVAVNITETPIVDAGLDRLICKGDSVKLELTSSENAVLTCASIPDLDMFIMPTVTTEYNIQAALNGCTSNSIVTIMVEDFEANDFSFTPVQPTVEDTEVDFSYPYGQEGYAYEWRFGDASNGSLQQETSYTYPSIAGITYDVSLIVTNEIGCIDTVYNQIYINDVLVYFIPNAFTPDGDPLNHSFLPVFTSGFDPQDYHLLIFNRWGEVIFESYNSANGWDGNYASGEPVADGVYVYAIDFGDLLSDERYEVRGHVTLLR